MAPSYGTINYGILGFSNLTTVIVTTNYYLVTTTCKLLLTHVYPLQTNVAQSL